MKIDDVRQAIAAQTEWASPMTTTTVLAHRQTTFVAPALMSLKMKKLKITDTPHIA